MRDLGEHLRQADQAWETATAEQRSKSREDYRRAGWRLCDHDDHRPWARCDELS